VRVDLEKSPYEWKIINAEGVADRAHG
jgi:hypothetical protein